MKILVIGFQRSGTTLLRRIIQVHPEVRRICHESFLLIRFPSKPLVMNHIKHFKINPKIENWGEKVPYYSVTRKPLPPERYCEIWNEYFPKDGRIIHIVRHPYDVAFSVNKKTKAKKLKLFNVPLSVYNKRVSNSVPFIMNLPNTYTVKYEHMLLEPDIVIPSIYEFCGLDPTIDYKAQLGRLKNKKYQQLNSSRVFAYKNKKVDAKVDCTNLFKILNKIDGPRYEI